MAVYLVEHPPRTQQYRCPRREHPSGVIGVHTAESFPDDDPPDDGAENVARFIANRTSYGSYHLLADSDSIIQLIEYDCVAYHIATHGLNEHTIGLSAATQAHRWDDLPGWWVDATLRNMARAAADAARWLHREHGITVPPRRITLSQALNRQPGFVAHADADPDRRTDPGRSFPWDDFLAYYAAEMGDDMSVETVKQGFAEALSEAADRDSKYGRNVGSNLARALARGGLDVAVARAVADRDGLFDAPPDNPKAEDNRHWRLRNHVKHQTNQTLYVIPAAIAEVDERERANGAKLDALMEAHEGRDLTSIKAHVDERYAEAAAERAELSKAVVDANGKLDAAERRDAAILDLLEQYNAGSLDAQAVVDGVRDLLHQATAPDGTEDDT